MQTITKLKFKSGSFYNFFYQFFYQYLSAKYFQENKERLQKQTRERYQILYKEEKEARRRKTKNRRRKAKTC